MNDSNTINEYLKVADVEEVKHMILLSSSSDSTTTWEDENVTYTIFISNRGNLRENVTLNVSIPNGWDYLLDEKNIQIYQQQFA